MSKEDNQIQRGDVAAHNSETDAWVIIDNKVYDITKFAKFHPGGAKLLLEYAGKDVTKDFYSLHRQDVLTKYHPRLCIGTLVGEKDPGHRSKPGEISKVPYCEPSYWQGFRSQYYNESHTKLRVATRKWIEKHIKPTAMQLDNAGKSPTPKMWELMGEAGLLGCRIGPGAHLSLPGMPPILGGVIQPKDFDYFHEMVVHEEFARLGCPGYIDGLGAGLVIGLPPVINYGKGDFQKKVVSEVLSGKKKICLAITEPFAGSDVADIRCTAVKSADGTHYIVNGVKKWITNGTFADYFTTAVRTPGGISLLCIERSEGLTTTPIKTSYSPAAGTAYVVYENVKVPVENLLGAENKGFACIMANFNHERWMIVVLSNRFARMLAEEAFKWASQRIVFGKPLVAQPVIRNKLAHMFGQIEAMQNWNENITYQMSTLSYKEQVKLLAGPIALLKLQSTRVAWNVCDEANQILGGRAITRTGMGQIVQKITAGIKFTAIYGGSEEIMADLGVRQALKYYPRNAKL